jgi:hypothetical protein
MPGGLPTSSTRGRGQNREGHPLGVRGPPRLDRKPSRARAQRHEHLPVLMAVETQTRPGV